MWRYRYLEGIGENVELQFVAAKLTGDYRLRSGSYDVAIVVNDPPSGRFGTVFAELNVPHMTTAK
jgi:hypothetical protein